MINIDSKDINLNLYSKDGYVKCTKIQKHIPMDTMMLIKLETNNFLFVQRNHPITVKRKDTTTDIEAKNIILTDKIYVNNKRIFCNNNDTIYPLCSEDHIANLIYEISNRELDIEVFKNINNSLLTGNSIYELRFNKTIFTVCNKYISKLLLLLNEVNIKSISLLQQLVLLSFKVNKYFDYYLDDKNEFSIKLISKDKESDNYGNICDYVNIKSILLCDNYNGYVYDVTTSSGDFMNGCTVNHNSFHLGGAVLMSKLNIISELMENLDDSLESEVKNIIKQEDNDLINISKDTCTVEIIKTSYIEDNKIKEDEKYYILPVGHFLLKFKNNFKIPVTIEKEVKIHKTDNKEETDEILMLFYTENEHIFTVLPTQEDFGKLSREALSIASGKSPWFSVEGLYKKFFKLLESTSGFDSVHLEIVISNLLRAKKDLQKPARLVEPFDPIMVSIKSLPGIMSWPLGLAFEHFSNAIRQGMISDRMPESSIEKIMFGKNLVEE